MKKPTRHPDAPTQTPQGMPCPDGADIPDPRQADTACPPPAPDACPPPQQTECPQPTVCTDACDILLNEEDFAGGHTLRDMLQDTEACCTTVPVIITDAETAKAIYTISLKEVTQLITSQGSLWQTQNPGVTARLLELRELFCSAVHAETFDASVVSKAKDKIQTIWCARGQKDDVLSTIGNYIEWLCRAEHDAEQFKVIRLALFGREQRRITEELVKILDPTATSTAAPHTPATGKMIPTGPASLPQHVSDLNLATRQMHIAAVMAAGACDLAHAWPYIECYQQAFARAADAYDDILCHIDSMRCETDPHAMVSQDIVRNIDDYAVYLIASSVNVRALGEDAPGLAAQIRAHTSELTAAVAEVKSSYAAWTRQKRGGVRNCGPLADLLEKAVQPVIAQGALLHDSFDHDEERDAFLAVVDESILAALSTYQRVQQLEGFGTCAFASVFRSLVQIDNTARRAPCREARQARITISQAARKMVADAGIGSGFFVDKPVGASMRPGRKALTVSAVSAKEAQNNWERAAIFATRLQKYAAGLHLQSGADALVATAKQEKQASFLTPDPQARYRRKMAEFLGTAEIIKLAVIKARPELAAGLLADFKALAQTLENLQPVTINS